MAKSSVSIFRQKILGKGWTEHSGRGFYEMWTDLSREQVLTSIDKFVAKNKKLVKRHYVDKNGWVCLELKAPKGVYYNELSVPPVDRWLPVRSWQRLGLNGPRCMVGM